MAPDTNRQAIPATEILEVAGHHYAFGLHWTSARSPATLEAEAKEAALSEGANYLVVHRTYRQFGLARVKDAPTGFRRWFYRPRSGIAAVARALGAATLAAFPLEDGRWLVLAIDKKGFLPDGDTIVANGELAKIRIATLIAQNPTSWRRRFVPADWGIADATTVDPKALLANKAGHTLKPVALFVNRTRIRTGLAAGVTALVIAGVVAAKLAFAPLPIVIAPVQPPKPVAAVWTPAALSLESCLTVLRGVQRFNAMPSWSPVKYSCAGGEALTIEFARVGNGQIGMLRGLLPQAHLADDGRSAVLALSLPPLPRTSATGAFTPREHYRVLGLDLAQRLNGSFAIQAGRNPLPGETDATPPNQAWRSFAWSYQTQAPATAWASAIARFGAISVDSLVFTPADNLWQISGSLYASN